MSRFARALAAILLALFAVPTSASAQGAPKVGHVFIIVLENEGYADTFGPKSPAAFLNALAKHGALLENYYGIGHYSLDNYLAMISGQAPNPVTQADCPTFIDFISTGAGGDGQALGQGCVFPSTVATIANQLDAKGLTWKGYMEDMGNLPDRERITCGHPQIGEQDNTHKAAAADQYASRHDPFVYFHKIIDDAVYCDAHVVNFRALAADLLDETTTPNYAFITPNLCHDGHDGGGKTPCADGTYPGGLISADKFLADIVPNILASPAFKHDGLLIITFDEADIDIDIEPGDTARTLKVTGDASACCGEPHGPNIKPELGARLCSGRHIARQRSRRCRPRRRQDRRGSDLAIHQTRHHLAGAVQSLFDASQHRGPFRPRPPRLRRTKGPEELRLGRLHATLKAPRQLLSVAPNLRRKNRARS